MWEFIDCRNEILIKTLTDLWSVYQQGVRSVILVSKMRDKNLFALSVPEKSKG